MEEKENIMDKLKEQVEEKIELIQKSGIKPENIENLYKLVDIHKDIANEDYWKSKEEGEKSDMRYGNYGAYSEGSYGRRGVPGSGRGGYSEGSFGRRGVKGTGRGRYRGEEKIEEMAYHYGNYSEGGSYGAEGQTVEALEYMMEAAYEFICMLSEEAKSPEETKIIKHYAKKISEL